MKLPVLLSIVTALGGFALGYLATRQTGEDLPAASEIAAAKSKAEPREASARNSSPSTRMQAMADRTAKLTSTEWPAFFRARLDSPEESRLAARLWAESDPAGFWSWLKEERDLFLLDRFGADMMKVWALTDPDAAMDAAWQVTHKIPGDKLRRAVVDSTFNHNLQKGLELMARMGSAESYGSGPREWMKTDPATAVKGLAALPSANRYGIDLLEYALSAWIEMDSGAAIEWLKSDQAQKCGVWTQPSPEMQRAFRKAAEADSKAALEVARSYADPEQRDEALAGVLEGWKGDLAEVKDALEDLPLLSLVSLGTSTAMLRPANTVADLEQSSSLLEVLPPSGATAKSTEDLARKWRRIDRDAGLKWAESLADPVSRSRAQKVLQPALTPEEMPPEGDDPFGRPSE